MVGRTKNIEALFLIVLHDHLGGFRIGERAYARRETGSRTVHEFNTAFSQNGVIGRSHPQFPGFHVGVFLGNIEIRLLQNTKRFLDLVGEDGRHTGVQQWAQVGEIVFQFDMGRQKRPRKFKRFFQVFQRLHLHPREGINDRQVIGRVGKPDFRAGVIGLKSVSVFALNLCNYFVATLNGCECY
jgi:hypothetical protein